MHPDSFGPEDFRQAFQRIRHQLSERQCDMLRAHYNAPDRKITAKQLAGAVGSPNYKTANSTYGKIGSLLCEILGQEPGHIKLFVLVNFFRPENEYIWQMREPAAQALKELGMV
ncbi:MAG TPA: hypothetical protein VG754_12480 [Verrucomicrobiae bacterium]|nr:hypothetical protein [Verrucomicrobiae bacterium]